MTHAEYDRNAWRNDERGIDVHKLIPAWQALQTAAPLAHIENEADYEQATALLKFDAVRDDASRPLYSLISVVGDLIEACEIEHESRLG
jgi:HTH-type transcriptional regulator/antitoxin HigA